MKKLLAVAFCGLVVAGVKADDAADADLKKLAGTWQLVSEVADGTERPADDVKKTKFIIDAQGNWKVEQDGAVAFMGTLKPDPAKKPKVVDYTLTSEGDLKGRVVKAIYEIDGDTFKHCWTLEGERPTKFESKEGSRHTYSVFKREKK